MRAALCASTMTVRSTSTPLALASTRNSVRPSVSPGAPALRAATINRSATLPSTTKHLSPVSAKPLPLRSALSAVALGACFVRSSTASARRRSPAASFGKSSRVAGAVAVAQKRRGAEQRRRQKRRRRQIAADLLHDRRRLRHSRGRSRRRPRAPGCRKSPSRRTPSTVRGKIRRHRGRRAACANARPAPWRRERRGRCPAPSSVLR